MLTKYKQQCQDLVKEWIEAVTCEEGAKLFDLKYSQKDIIKNIAIKKIVFEDYQESIFDYQIELSHTHKVDYTEEVVAGDADKKGEITHSKEEYKKAIECHLANERNNPKLLTLLIEKIKQKNSIYEEQNKLSDVGVILYTHSCDTCNGNTEQKCERCKGQGEVRCSDCAGKGEYRCPKCNGRGEVKCEECRGDGSCSKCRGRGYNGDRECYECGCSGKCKKCNGKGIIWCDGKTYTYVALLKRYSTNNYYKCKGGFVECEECNRTGYKRCSTCGGATIVTCKTCKGTNKVTQVAQIGVWVQTNYKEIFPSNASEEQKEIIKKYQKNEIANMANVTKEIKQEENRVVEIYQIQVPYAKFNLLFNDKKIAWSIFGTKPKVQNGVDETLRAFREFQWHNIIFRKLTKKPYLISICLGIAAYYAVMTFFGLADTKILGNYSFSYAAYDNGKSNATNKQYWKEKWKWEKVPNESYLKLDENTFSVSIGCSTFTGNHTIKKYPKKSSGEVGTILLNNTTKQKPQTKCDSQRAEIEKQVVTKIFSENSQLKYFYDIDSKEIQLQIKENDSLFVSFLIIAKKEQE